MVPVRSAALGELMPEKTFFQIGSHNGILYADPEEETSATIEFIMALLDNRELTTQGVSHLNPLLEQSQPEQ